MKGLSEERTHPQLLCSGNVYRSDGAGKPVILDLEKHVSVLPSLHGIRNSPGKGLAGLWGLAGIWRGGQGAIARITSGPGRDTGCHVY